MKETPQEHCITQKRFFEMIFEILKPCYDSNDLGYIHDRSAERRKGQVEHNIEWGTGGKRTSLEKKSLGWISRSNSRTRRKITY